MTAGLWVLILVLFVLVFLLLVSAAIFCAAFVRFPKRAEEKLETREDPEPLINEGVRWIREQNCKKVEIRSYDGLRLAARVLPAENAKGTLILIHGYRSPMYHDFACILPFYHALGYNLLIPSQRTHGESEGKYICYGIRERYDCKAWAAFAETYFEPGGDIFLSGVSMGSATVLMASDLTLPDTVRGIIADCGFRDCSTLESVANTKLPILFVHGKADTFVPCRFTEENYAACRSEKELVLVENAGHGMSYLLETERCQQILKNFLERYSGCKRSMSTN